MATKETTKTTVKAATKKAPAKATPKAFEAEVLTAAGTSAGTVQLPESVFGARWNADLVHEVVVGMQSNARKSTADTKGRGEVRGGGKKPWKQKGTGRARHGSRRSPIWVGGGVAHGPLSEKDYSKKINRNVRARALATVLSKKYADGEMIFVDTFGFAAPKTTEARKALLALGEKGVLMHKKSNAALVILPARNESVEKSFRNFGNVLAVQAKDVSPVDLLSYKYVVVAEPAATLEVFEHRTAVKRARKTAK